MPMSLPMPRPQLVQNPPRRRRSIGRAILSIALAAAASTSALANLPADQTLRCVVPVDPNDPDSPIAREFELTLQALQQVGSEVEWRIAAVTICNGASPPECWTDSDPTAAGGTWWVSHADPENPSPSEFAAPPELTGTALSPNGELTYSLWPTQATSLVGYWTFEPEEGVDVGVMWITIDPPWDPS